MKPRQARLERVYVTTTKMKFRVFGLDHSTVNAIRRMMHSEIPTLAIDRIEVDKNTSTVYPEEMKERLSMIVLRSNRNHISITDGVDGYGGYCFHHVCSCTEGCPKCCVKLHLNVTNTDPILPRKVTVADLTVLDPSAGDIVIAEIDDQKKRSSSSMSIYEETSLLWKLQPGGTVQLTAYAYVGKGLMHVKWTPVSPAFFNYTADIELSPEIQSKWTDDQRTKLKAACPTRVFELEELMVVSGSGSGSASGLGLGVGSNDGDANHKSTPGGGGGSIDEKNKTAAVASMSRLNVKVARPDQCMFCRECTKYALSIQRDGDIEIRPKSEEFLFELTSRGSLSPREIVQQSIRLLQSKWQTLLSDLEQYDS